MKRAWVKIDYEDIEHPRHEIRFNHPPDYNRWDWVEVLVTPLNDAKEEDFEQ